MDWAKGWKTVGVAAGTILAGLTGTASEFTADPNDVATVAGFVFLVLRFLTHGSTAITDMLRGQLPR